MYLYTRIVIRIKEHLEEKKNRKARVEEIKYKMLQDMHGEITIENEAI